MPRKRMERLAEQRQAAHLYLAGRTQTEIAEVIGRSQATVSRDLAVVREEWRKQAARDHAAWVAEQLASLEWIWTHLAPQLVAKTSKPNEKARVASVMLDVLRQRGALLGLDAPTRLAIMSTEEVEAEAARVAEAIAEARAAGDAAAVDAAAVDAAAAVG